MMKDLEVFIGKKTHIGKVRKVNQDSFCSERYLEEDSFVKGMVAVADGMGGQEAGEVASKIAVETLQEVFRPVSKKEINVENVGTVLKDAFYLANERVHFVSSDKFLGMGTTLTAGIFTSDTFYIGQVGDSRAYLVRKGMVKQLTQDHSWVAEQVRKKQMTEEEALLSPQRNLITRSIGSFAVVEVDLYSEKIEDGDLFLLCSDGLHGLVTAKEIVKYANLYNNMQDLVEKLIDLSNERGGRDNITVVAVKFASPEKLQEEAEKPKKNQLNTARSKKKEKIATTNNKDKLHLVILVVILGVILILLLFLFLTKFTSFFSLALCFVFLTTGTQVVRQVSYSQKLVSHKVRSFPEL